MKQDHECLTSHLDARLQPLMALSEPFNSAMNTTVSDPARDHPSICLRLVCHRFENVPRAIRSPSPYRLRTCRNSRFRACDDSRLMLTIMLYTCVKP